MDMATYTVQLRKLIESNYDIGLHDYPIWDEEYRDVLNKKIINHYFMREIGFETAGLFKHYLNTTMDEIMPYYNQLYKSALLEIDPLLTFKETEIKTKDSTSTGTSDSKSNNIRGSEGGSSSSGDTKYENLSVHSDTPQGEITETDIKNNKWASSTDYTKYQTNDDTSNSTYHDNITDTGSSKASSSAIGHDNENKVRSGFNGKSLSELLLKYRETFLNIDMMIIDELNNLFMLVW